jgi:hypothetical protein
MTDRGRARLMTEENDRLALQWAGPVGWALLQVVRRNEEFSEADFQALIGQGEYQARMQGLLGLHRALPEAEPPPENTAVQTGVLEPPPPPEHYRVVRPGHSAQGQPSTRRRPLQPAAPTTLPPGPTTTVYRPAGERDASGRIVKRI